MSWNVPFDDYKPPDYTDESIKGKEWADPEINEGQFKWNELDNEVNRESHFWYAFSCRLRIHIYLLLFVSANTKLMMTNDRLTRLDELA